MRVLVVGSGAREHALAWKLAQSSRVAQLFVAPGNGGTAEIATNLPIKAPDVKALVRAAAELEIGLVVVGPEAALAEGLVDALEAKGIPAFGPTQAAAAIETSKVFAKELMQRYGIPCAQSRSFDRFEEALYYVNNIPCPIVVKADGLAAGKGSVVCATREQAHEALAQMMVQRVFGAAADRVVVEECLEGPEVSLLAFADGKTVVPMVPACDYKRVWDGDEGPNTGGMGAYSPPSFFDQRMVEEVTRTVLERAGHALAAAGTPYRGVLYAGLMLTKDGPKNLEFNARFGDPETQVILPRLKTDLVEIMLAVVEGRLQEVEITWQPQPCVGVVLASEGYPGSYETGRPLVGLERLNRDVLAFHAGTRRSEDGGFLTDGGRVLTLAALGETLAQAREKAYRNLTRISFQGCHYRRDIALREVIAQPMGR